MTSNRDYLASRLAAGPFRVGQVTVLPDFHLFHSLDAGRDDLAVFTDPHDAVEISRLTAEGAYRPLRSAPNLRRGWRLELPSLADLHLALDILYPAALGTARELAAGSLCPTPLRATLERQTGMYAVTRTVSDEGVEKVKAALCRPGCLKTILWDAGRPRDLVDGFSARDREPVPTLPLLCPEICALFVARARQVVKAGGPGTG